MKKRSIAMLTALGMVALLIGSSNVFAGAYFDDFDYELGDIPGDTSSYIAYDSNLDNDGGDGYARQNFTGSGQLRTYTYASTTYSGGICPVASNFFTETVTYQFSDELAANSRHYFVLADGIYGGLGVNGLPQFTSPGGITDNGGHSIYLTREVYKGRFDFRINGVSLCYKDHFYDDYNSESLNVGGAEVEYKLVLGYDGTNIVYEVSHLYDDQIGWEVITSGTQASDNWGDTYCHLSQRGTANYGSSGYYNYVSWTPEPATMSLLGVGALALLRRRR